jgi:hypothetical protein
MVRTIFAQPDADTVCEQHQRVVVQLEDRFPDAAALLDEAGVARLHQLPERALAAAVEQ